MIKHGIGDWARGPDLETRWLSRWRQRWRPRASSERLLRRRSNRADADHLNPTSRPSHTSDWSMVAHGDRLLALSEGGELYLIAANTKEYEVIE